MPTSTQISIYDYLLQRRDDYIADWEGWRDAQFANDADKALVDEHYMEYIRTLDTLIHNMTPF